MDEGWTRWLLEQFGFRYTSLSNREIQSNKLRERFDVIVFPDQRAESIHVGYKPGAMPEQYTGGVGDIGAEALKQFAAKGGTIVFLNNASEYAAQYLGVSVNDALSGISNREFYAPGTLLNARLGDHPLTLGLPKDIPIWFESGPAFEVSGRDRAIASLPGYADTRLGVAAGGETPRSESCYRGCADGFRPYNPFWHTSAVSCSKLPSLQAFLQLSLVFRIITRT